jgi:hypothetical protein
MPRRRLILVLGALRPSAASERAAGLKRERSVGMGADPADGGRDRIRREMRDCGLARARADPWPLLHRAGPTEGDLDAFRRRLPALGAARYCRRTSRWHRLKPGSEPPSSDGASLSRQEEARATASYHEWAWTSLRAARFPAARALASHM